MTLPELEKLMQPQGFWSLRVDGHGKQGFTCQISIPSYEFHGMGESLELAIGAAAMRVKNQFEVWNYKRYDI